MCIRDRVTVAPIRRDCKPLPPLRRKRRDGNRFHAADGRIISRGIHPDIADPRRPQIKDHQQNRGPDQNHRQTQQAVSYTHLDVYKRQAYNGLGIAEGGDF